MLYEGGKQTRIKCDRIFKRSDRMITIRLRVVFNYYFTGQSRDNNLLVGKQAGVRKL